MEKAKSRLSTPTSAIAKVRTKTKKLTLIKKYYKHLPLLLLSLPFYIGVYLILNHLSPSKIEHFLIPNTYLPLQLTLFIGNFFFFSYLLLKTRRGLEISFLIALTLFLKLQIISNYLHLSLTIWLVVTTLEIIISFLKKD